MKRRFIARAAAAFCAALFVCSGTASAKNVQYTYDHGNYEGVFTVDMMEFLSKEALPWTGEGCGIGRASSRTGRKTPCGAGTFPYGIEYHLLQSGTGL